MHTWPSYLALREPDTRPPKRFSDVKQQKRYHIGAPPLIKTTDTSWSSSARRVPVSHTLSMVRPTPATDNILIQSRTTHRQEAQGVSIDYDLPLGGDAQPLANSKKPF